jgi:hypothetical protein
MFSDQMKKYRSAWLQQIIGTGQLHFEKELKANTIIIVTRTERDAGQNS